MSSALNALQLTSKRVSRKGKPAPKPARLRCGYVFTGLFPGGDMCFTECSIVKKAGVCRDNVPTSGLSWFSFPVQPCLFSLFFIFLFFDFSVFCVFVKLFCYMRAQRRCGRRRSARSGAAARSATVRRRNGQCRKKLSELSVKVRFRKHGSRAFGRRMGPLSGKGGAVYSDRSQKRVLLRHFRQ